MRPLNSLTGLPVIWNGKLQGHVEQPVLSCDGSRLRGMVLRQGLRGARWVDSSHIMVLGGVSVIIDHSPLSVPGDADMRLTSAIDSAGLRLGLVRDVLLNPDTFEVEALLLSLGLVEALTCGPLMCRRFSVQPDTDGNYKAIIPSGAMLMHFSGETDEREESV